MDINLPGMSGYDAVRQLHEWPETKEIPVIALTAAAMLGDRKRELIAERALREMEQWCATNALAPSATR